jgi:hypothetical protein
MRFRPLVISTMTTKAQHRLPHNDLVEIVREVLSGECPDERRAELCSILEQQFAHPAWTELMYISPLSYEMRSPEEIVDLALAYVPVQIDHPLLTRLTELSEEATRDLCPGKDWQYVFDPIGLLFEDSIRKSSCWCDPENSVEFMSTGGDGHHFCFLVVGNTVSEASPILLCRPDFLDEPTVVVGENLYDFLCFGMHCGYFNVLGVLDYPDERIGNWYGEDVDEPQRVLLQFLREKLGLKPWTNRSRRFRELQDRYLPLFKMPPIDT